MIELSDVSFVRALPLTADKISLHVHLEMVTELFLVEVGNKNCCVNENCCAKNFYKNCYSRRVTWWFAEESSMLVTT